MKNNSALSAAAQRTLDGNAQSADLITATGIFQTDRSNKPNECNSLLHSARCITTKLTNSVTNSGNKVMAYSEDYDDYEQDSQGQELDREISEHEKMCSHFGLSTSEFADLSGNEQQNIRWNWRHIQKRIK